MTIELAMKIGEVVELVKAIWVCGVIITCSVVIIAVMMAINIDR